MGVSYVNIFFLITLCLKALISTLSLQTFVPLVDKHGLSDEERPVPVEFVGDHERCIMINLLSLFFFFFAKCLYADVTIAPFTPKLKHV